MKANEIYNELRKFWDPDQENGLIPKDLEERGVKVSQIDDCSGDVISHKEYYGSDGGKVVEIIESHDHCRAFEIRPDTNHFDLTLYDLNGDIKGHSHFMTVDEM